MAGVSDGLEEKLAGKLGDFLEPEITREISSFGGLLTRHAAVLLLCKQNGIDVERKIHLADAQGERLPFSFSAKVARVYPIQTYGAKPGCSVRLHITDGSAEATLVLWNEQARLAEEGEICVGDDIECKGAYARAGEIMVSKGGSVRRVNSREVRGGSPAADARQAAVLEGVAVGEGETIFKIGGREFALANNEAALAIGIKALVSGVSIGTAISIKAQEMVGKEIRYKIEGGRLCSLSQ